MTEPLQIPPSPPPQVLVVDDTPANLQVVAQVLAPEGYRVRVAPDGEAALASIRAQAPDLVLLDVRMPGLDGFEVCARIKADPEHRDLPVIFLTAAGESEDVVRGFEAGGTDYVTKPFRAPELLARIRTHLDLRRALRSERRLVGYLQEALDNVKLLEDLVPICGCCKKIRNDQGFWQQLESYLHSRLGTRFSHGICPDCVREHYPDLAKRVLGEGSD